jgi:hypothetical protein
MDRRDRIVGGMVRRRRTYRVGRITRVLRSSTFRSPPWLSPGRRSVRLRWTIDPDRPRERITMGKKIISTPTKKTAGHKTVSFPENEEGGMMIKRTHDCPAHVARRRHFDCAVKAPLFVFGLGHCFGGRVSWRVARYVDLGSAWPGCRRARVVRDAKRVWDDPHHFVQCRVGETCRQRFCLPAS